MGPRAVDPSQARFPLVPPSAGHYESFYLKLCDPDRPRGAWIRYTVHKRPAAAPTGSVWFTLFEERGPTAAKATAPAPLVTASDWIRIDGSQLGDGFASGSAGAAVSWDLRFESAEPALYHLPSERMYRARLPRTKLLSPLPAATFEGTLAVDGRELMVDGWRGMVGHNWGAQHAERWIWLHALTSDGDWLDVAMGKVKLGPLVTPWLGSGALSLAGERHRLGGLTRRVRVLERPERCDFSLSGAGLVLRGGVAAPRERFVGWIYADPDGPEHQVVNCSIADLSLLVELKGQQPRALSVVGAAAYELGMRERDHGMTIQPFPDG